MLTLRPEQNELKQAVYTHWQQGARTVLAVASTGFGKTVLFTSVVHDHNGGAAVLVHRREILVQISLTLAAFEIKHRINAPKAVQRIIRRKHLAKFKRSYIDDNSPVGVVSAQTVTARQAANNNALQRWLKQVTLVVADEAHHYVTGGTWASAVECFPSCQKQLHVTATPKRADGKGLGRHASGYVDAMVLAPDINWLIDQGRLTPMTYYAPDSDLDTDGMPIGAAGDFTAPALKAMAKKSHIVGDVVEHYQRFAPGMRCLVFAPDVDTSREMADAFNLAGVPAAAVDGTTPDGQREQAFTDFEGSKLRVLVNVDLADEGVDIPGIEAVLMARPTWSLAKYMQQIGRALRVMDGKERAIIIDSVRNWSRFPGGPLAPRDWSLDDADKASRGGSSDTIPQRVCTECTQPYEAFHAACPYCGHVEEPPGRREPAQVDGDLTELDVQGMAAMLGAIARADMSDADYHADMIARNVPAVGRPRQLKAHKAAKYRRGVLRELLAWWCGMQEGRSQAEIYRRFYHRFGTDMGTALTLNAADTDALIERVQAGFAKDVIL